MTSMHSLSPQDPRLQLVAKHIPYTREDWDDNLRLPDGRPLRELRGTNLEGPGLPFLYNPLHRAGRAANPEDKPLFATWLGPAFAVWECTIPCTNHFEFEILHRPFWKGVLDQVWFHREVLTATSTTSFRRIWPFYMQIGPVGAENFELLFRIWYSQRAYSQALAQLGVPCPRNATEALSIMQRVEPTVEVDFDDVLPLVEEILRLRTQIIAHSETPKLRLGGSIPRMHAYLSAIVRGRAARDPYGSQFDAGESADRQCIVGSQGPMRRWLNRQWRFRWSSPR